MAQKARGYKEKITDSQLINMIESGIMNSVGRFLSSSDLAHERMKSTYEYAGVAKNHLTPQGVSSIVASDTTEVIEAYLAIISELMFENNKIAKFLPYESSPSALFAAEQASDLVNYCIFKKNDGWKIFNTWVKSALLWKTAVIRWDYIEEFDHTFEEYEVITQVALDELLANDNVEIVGDLILENSLDPDESAIYRDVRIKKKIDRSRIVLEVIPPENFRIDRHATSISDSSFVAIQREMTRSEIRKQFPEMADKVGDWDRLGESYGNSIITDYSEERAVRKEVTGQEYWNEPNVSDLFETEANTEVSVTESWFKVDRDGDGVAELKYIISVGDHILHEEDVDEIPLADLCPFEIPHEFYGLSMSDMVRSSTLASTAILRGFVENTYLTNYSPKLADPNVVDFSALQNMKPKQLIATNGNPAAAVQNLPPETISSSIVPLLEFLQLHKEQATGMSKAAQGLNDTLYVSGNSEQKVAQVQSAAQKRIQNIVRRFAETGFKRCIKGVYKTMRKNMKEVSYYNIDNPAVYKSVNLETMPKEMDVEILVDVGENSNSTKLMKLQRIAQEVIPAVQNANAGMAIKPEAPLVLAFEILKAMDVDPQQFFMDYEDPQFRQQAAQAMQQSAQEEQEKKQQEQQQIQSKIALEDANVRYTHVQADNSLQDNTKQLAVALDKSSQEWSKISLDAAKEGLQLPPHPSFEELFAMAAEGVRMIGESNKAQEQQAPSPEQLLEIAKQQGLI